MNKKLIASLLTLGLVLSPVSGAVSESYATEVSSEERDRELALEKIGIIKNYLNYYQSYKDSNDYRLADDASRAKLDKAAIDAEEYSKKNKVSLAELDKHIINIENAIAELASNASDNQKSLKINIINSNKLLANNDTKKETDEYKLVSEKIANAMAVLKKDNIDKSDFKKLITANSELVDAFSKAIKKFEDKTNYDIPKDEEISKLDEELNKEVEVNVDFKKLLEDRQALIKKDGNFKLTTEYIGASQEKKDAYEKAFEELNSITDLSENLENYKIISEKVRNLVKAIQDIDGKDHNLDAKEIENEIRILKSYINDKGNVNKIFSNPDFKDDALKKSYNEAFTKALNVVLGKEKLKDLKEYQDLSAKLKKLTDEIKSKKISEIKPTDTTKLDKLKSSIEKGNKFFISDAYDKADKDKRDKFLKALVEAEALKKKYDENPALVKDEEIEKATKALDEALAGFDKFSDKDKARDAIKGLLGLTKGIKIEQIYDTKDTKEAKEAYTKAREKAAKLADDKKASLEDLDKAYKDFNESVVKLAEFLTSRLQKLVDDDKTFRESDKYKDAEKDSKKEEAIKNYKKLVEDGEKELKKAAPDANILNVLYKKLMNARDEINGVIKTSWGRKLADAILDYEILKVVPKYNPRVGALTGERKKAADFYTKYLAAAKELKKAGKLDSQDAKDLLDLINHARDFIEGNITEKQYLINFYYHNLKALRDYKNQEEFKKLPQALRDKLNKALDFYNESSDEDAVFSALDAVWQENEIQALIDKIKAENDPNNARNNLLIKLREMAEKSNEFIKDDKYKNAPKELRADYDRALEAAKKVLGAEKPTEKEVKDAYDGLKLAIDRIETRSIIDRRLVVLAENFKKNQLKIANPADRQAIADKINALKKNPYTTIEEVDAVEKELNDLINPKFAATQTLVPQGQVPTTSRPISTVTNPGSIVKTGINGIAKVAVVLVAALGIFILTSKKGDKNENN